MTQETQRGCHGQRHWARTESDIGTRGPSACCGTTLGLTGTKLVCAAGVCGGACTVQVDGKPMVSCLLPYAAIEGPTTRPAPVQDLYGDGSDPTRDHLLGPAEVLLSVELPIPVPDERAAYHRTISRAEAEWPLVEAVARLAWTSRRSQRPRWRSAASRTRHCDCPRSRPRWSAGHSGLTRRPNCWLLPRKRSSVVSRSRRPATRWNCSATPPE